MILPLLEIAAGALAAALAWIRSAEGAVALSPEAGLAEPAAEGAMREALGMWAAGMFLMSLALGRAPTGVRRALVVASALAFAFAVSIDPLGTHLAGRGQDALALGAAAVVGAALRWGLHWRRWTPAGVGVVACLGAVVVVGVQALVGERVGGQILSISAAGFHVQGVEFVKVLALGGLALSWCAWRDRLCHGGVVALAFAAACTAIAGVAVVLADAGGAAVTLSALALFGGAVLARRAIGPLPVVAGALLTLPTVARAAADHVGSGFGARLRMYLSPWVAGDVYGEHVATALMAVASGGLFGRGAARVVESHLAEGRTDFAIATLCEAWGLLGALAWVGVLAALVRSLGSAAARDGQDPWRPLAAVIAAILAAQAFVGSGGALGLVVLTGVVSPFLSSSTSFAAALGLALGAAFGRVLPSTPDAVLRRVGLHAAGAVLVLSLGLVLPLLDPDLRIGRRVAVAPGRGGGARVVHDPRFLDAWGAVGQAALLDARGRAITLDRPDGERITRPSPAWTPVLGLADSAWPLPGTFEAARRAADRPRPLPGVAGALDLSPWLPLVRAGAEEATGVLGALRPEPFATGLDRAVQEAIYAILPRWFTEAGASRIAVSVVEIGTGLQRARVSFPSVTAAEVPVGALDDLRFSGRFGLLLDTVGLAFPPGSTMKPAVMLAAARAGRSAERTWPCDGKVVIRDGSRSRTIHDHAGMRARGPLSLAEALPPSCNTPFAAAGAEIGGTVLRETLAPLLGELPIADDPIDAALAAIGQGRVEWSAFDAALLYAMLGGSGSVPRCPLLWRGPLSCERVTIGSPAEMAPIRAAMREVVRSGTGRGARLPEQEGVAVAGKSGTADQGPVLPDDLSRENIAWFNGVIEGSVPGGADASSPQYAFSIVVARTSFTGGHFSPLAVEIARVLQAEGYLR